jgi:hypothetical protein
VYNRVHVGPHTKIADIDDYLVVPRHHALADSGRRGEDAISADTISTMSWRSAFSVSAILA